MLGLNRKAIFRINYKSPEEIRKCIYILGKGMAQTSVCHLLVRIWLTWQRNHPQLQNIKKIYFLPVLVVLIQRKSAVIVLTRVRKYKTTCLGPHIAGANPYNRLKDTTFQDGCHGNQLYHKYIQYPEAYMNSTQKHTICLIFMIPVDLTRKNMGLKTHSEASYNALIMLLK